MSRFVLLGHPVAHSVSPAIHGAAYRSLGLDHRYELLDVPDEGALARAVGAVRSGEIAGANVTVPWKRRALALADRSAPSAADVGAANVLARNPAGAVVAHNTDVTALVEELRELAPSARRVLVLGSGGAALAAVAAARFLGATSVAVSARKWSGPLDAASWPHAAELVALGAAALPWRGPELAAFAIDADVIVQATSAGMHGAAPGSEVASVLPWERIATTCVAYDLVYNPADTEFLRSASETGHVARGGLGMLVGQAALAFELWLGVRPPREPMQRAAEAALSARKG